MLTHWQLHPKANIEIKMHRGEPLTDEGRQGWFEAIDEQASAYKSHHHMFGLERELTETFSEKAAIALGIPSCTSSFSTHQSPSYGRGQRPDRITLPSQIWSTANLKCWSALGLMNMMLQSSVWCHRWMKYRVKHSRLQHSFLATKRLYKQIAVYLRQSTSICFLELSSRIALVCDVCFCR